MEENRKRNLVNVSQHIMSPSQNSKAFSDQKGGAGFTRPPSHPGLTTNNGKGAPGGGLPLPPKPDQ